ncbi:MAG: TolC family protein [Bacteroidales bacterium]|nr:TolC family protein [Bacteroidales bacterium]MBN2748766.1 TolC family protein [Bacteroidales bacterium]
MKRNILVAALLWLPNCLLAQPTIDTLLLQIARNNPIIKSAGYSADAHKAESRIGLTPPNPTLGFGKMPSIKQGGGYKTVYGISQGFEFPTVYLKKAALAKSNAKLADTDAAIIRQEVMLEAKTTIIELLHANQMVTVYTERVTQAQKVNQWFETLVQKGEVSVIDLNNSKLRLMHLQTSKREWEATAYNLQLKLSWLNGGVATSMAAVADTSAQAVPALDAVLAKAHNTDARLAIVTNEKDVAGKELSLARHQWLPELEIAFESEETSGEGFRGLKFGIALPLWGNAGTVKAARLKVSAAESLLVSKTMEVENEYRSNYSYAESILNQINEIKADFDAHNNLPLLQKALELGSISSIDYYNEVTFLYEVTDKLMELERNYRISIAALTRYEL